MISINAGALVKLASALTSGDDNIIEKLIRDKIEDMGEDLIGQALSNVMPMAGAAQRALTALETGGVSEFARLRSQWLHSLIPSTSFPGGGALRRLQGAFEKNKHLLSRPGGIKLTWEGSGWDAPDVKWKRSWSETGGHWKWSKSRQEWLDVSWRHDWRTQPRDPHGKWIPGRLRHPYISKGARRIRRARRKAAREAVKAAWTRD